jgi:hypothetical protein
MIRTSGHTGGSIYVGTAGQNPEVQLINSDRFWVYLAIIPILAAQIKL